VALQYDEIGNPTVYIAGSRVFYMTWEGRLLKNATDSYNESYTFTYNADGLRTSKTYTYGSTTRVTNYYYSGSLLIGEETNGVMQTYLYDSSASPIGIQVNSGTNESTYLFRKNLQGDIIGVYDQSGNSIFSYNYTAWGNFIKYGTNTTVTNPFTYRGYYYDADLGMYYLGSRYYDSTTGRFISLDREDVVSASPMGLTDKNLYAYCDNNPITRVDKDGEFWHVLVGAAVGVISQYIYDVAYNITSGKKGAEVFKPQSSVVDYLASAASGALGATGVGAFGHGIANAAIDGTAYMLNQAIDGEEIDPLALVSTAITSGITAGKGADGANMIGVYKHSKKALQTAVSPKKIAMYSAKIADVKKTAAKYIFKPMGASVCTGLLNGAYDRMDPINKLLARFKR